MATYIFIFLLELTVAYVLWIILRRVLGTKKMGWIIVAALVVSLITGYVASYRYVGYQLTIDYLTTVNDQRIEETGGGITSQEEETYKEELAQRPEFQELLMTSAVKLTLFPLVLVAGFMLYFLPQRHKVILGILLLGWGFPAYSLISYFNTWIAYIFAAAGFTLFIRITGLWDWIKKKGSKYVE